MQKILFSTHKQDQTYLYVLILTIHWKIILANLSFNNKPSPIPVFAPYCIHWIQRNSFGLGQEQYDKDGDDCNPTRVEEESPKLKVAKHGQERLG